MPGPSAEDRVELQRGEKRFGAELFGRGRVLQGAPSELGIAVGSRGGASPKGAASDGIADGAASAGAEGGASGLAGWAGDGLRGPSSLGAKGGGNKSAAG